MNPTSDFSKNQIDRLGDRLRQGEIADEDLRLLDGYRRTFSDPYEIVVRRIRDRLNLEPTGRQEKTKDSIIAKLRRQNTRLSQMQDIAGCRIVVSDLTSQDAAVARIKTVFERFEIDDRREQSSHGYRAVHVIVGVSNRFIEVQVRTSLQHLWAEVSEKLSDVDASIKYGGGDREVGAVLNEMSLKIRDQELAEASYFRIMGSSDRDAILRTAPMLPEIIKSRLAIGQMLIDDVLPRIKGRD